MVIALERYGQRLLSARKVFPPFIFLAREGSKVKKFLSLSLSLSLSLFVLLGRILKDLIFPIFFLLYAHMGHFPKIKAEQTSFLAKPKITSICVCAFLKQALKRLAESGDWPIVRCTIP